MREPEPTIAELQAEIMALRHEIDDLYKEVRSHLRHSHGILDHGMHETPLERHYRALDHKRKQARS
jgi:hypothetical protein